MEKPMRSMLNSIVSAALLVPAGGAVAADVQTLPMIDLRVEQNDNIDLEPAGTVDGDVLGYIADMEVLFDIRTPRGNTALRPRVKVQDYPDRNDFERIESFFDIISRYEWQRSNFDFRGNYSRQDTYNSDTPSGGFDPVDPGGGGNPDTGALVIGETRTEVRLFPTFEHRVTERTAIGASADYQTARYESDDATTRTDYDFGVARGYLTWALSPASDFTVGAYASRFETRDDSQETDAVGGDVGFAHRWSETDGIEATVFYERNESTDFSFFPALEEETSSVGGNLTAYRKLEVSEWRLTAGTAIIPTGDRGKSESNYFRLQYDRLLTQRLSFRGAARYDGRTALGDLGGTDRDYARADLSVKWFVTPTWYLGGGYSYIWEDREEEVSDAHNNRIFINFGYQGLGRQNPGSISGP